MEENYNIIDKLSKKLNDCSSDSSELNYNEQLLIDYIKSTDDEEIFKLYSLNDETLINLALKYKFENFLCTVLDKYPKLAEIQDKYGNTFVHHAAKRDLVNVCLKALEVPKLAKIQNNKGFTFVHYAANLETVCLKALEVPELAEIQDNNGSTFVHYAAKRGLEKVCFKAFELNRESAKIKGQNGKTFIQILKENKSKNTIRNILNSRKVEFTKNK